jgi:hypothetical protein
MCFDVRFNSFGSKGEVPYDPIRIAAPPLGMTQTPKTYGAPQFPKESALSVRQIHRSTEELFNDFVLSSARSQQDLAFDAESLREPRERLV